MKLLCKLVTNPLKPMACAHPINLCSSLGSGLSDLHHCVGSGRGPWLESVINFPFLPVALSWRPSLFPLGDSDIGHNNSLLKFYILLTHLKHFYFMHPLIIYCNVVKFATFVLFLLCTCFIKDRSTPLIIDLLFPVRILLLYVFLLLFSIVFLFYLDKSFKQ